jgi:MFS family permease
VAGFNIFAGALLGVCAGLLWTAQCTIMVSYSMEKQKGKYFAWFWGIFNIGAVIGSLVGLSGCMNFTDLPLLSIAPCLIFNSDSPGSKHPRDIKPHCF